MKAVRGERLQAGLWAAVSRLSMIFSLSLSFAPSALGANFCIDVILMENLKPSETLVTVNLEHFDPYGHVNSSHYIGWALSAIWKSGKAQGWEPLDIDSSQRLTLTGVRIVFVRPIRDPGDVYVSLSKPEIDRGGGYQVPFRILHGPRKRVCSEGSMRFQTRFAANLGNLIVTAPIYRQQEVMGFGRPLVAVDSRRIQFDHLGPSGGEMHLGAYVALFVANRWNNVLDRFQMHPSTFAERGIGFVIKEIAIDIVEPVKAVSTVETRTWVSHVTDQGKQLAIAFEMVGEGRYTQVVHAEGAVTLVVVDNNGRPTPFQSWLAPFFFEPSN